MGFSTVNQDDEIHQLLSFASFPPDVLDDYSRIVEKLREADIFDKHLKVINDKIKEALEQEKKLTYDEDDDMVFEKKAGKRYTAHYHVLTNFFNQWFNENGFNIQTHVYCIETNESGEKNRISVELPSKMPVIVDLLSDSLFSAFLLRGIMAKDIGAGVAHGEFTHFFQIYAIVEENKINKFLINDPVKLIKESAPYFYIKNKEAPWRLMFDYIEDENFRSPYTFNATVNMAQRGINAKLELKVEEYPVLSELLQGRSDKRERKYRYNPNLYTSDYPYLHPDTKNKYLTQENGFVLDNAIFFPKEESSGSRKLTFDDISAELILIKKQIQDASPIQFAEATNLSLIDTLINLFSQQTLEKNKATIAMDDDTVAGLKNVTNILQMIKHNSEQPKETLSYRQILLTLLEKYGEIRDHEPLKAYYKSLLKVALDILDKPQLTLDQSQTASIKKKL